MKEGQTLARKAAIGGDRKAQRDSLKQREEEDRSESKKNKIKYHKQEI